MPPTASGRTSAKQKEQDPAWALLFSQKPVKPTDFSFLFHTIFIVLVYHSRLMLRCMRRSLSGIRVPVLLFFSGVKQKTGRSIERPVWWTVRNSVRPRPWAAPRRLALWPSRQPAGKPATGRFSSSAVTLPGFEFLLFFFLLTQNKKTGRSIERPVWWTVRNSNP